jgi:two-component system, response regulator PdtaR
MKPDESPPVVLVVEDEPLLQILATEGLEDAGFEVLAAWNADEALRVLEERAESVQVLFTDVRMPGSMDGMALAQAVHRRWPHILLVLSSGHARPSEDDLPDHGRFVPKPYTTAAIVRQIQELMTR